MVVRVWMLCWLSVLCLAQAVAQQTEDHRTLVTIPYMDRPALHRQYAEELLKKAMQHSEAKFGPVLVRRQRQEAVVGRQLKQLQQADWLSVAVSMPTPEWLEKAKLIPVPIMKGLASYRFFLTLEHMQPQVSSVSNIEQLKAITIGQGLGWSTGRILEANGFNVIYGVTYQTLFPMLNAERFTLLMRGSYEILPELEVFQPQMPQLSIADNIAMFTYLPMYFFVNRSQPEVAERLNYGLQLMQESGEFDALFEQYFGDVLEQLDLDNRKVFHLRNTNIGPSFFMRDKPHLLPQIVQEQQKMNQ